MNKEELNIISGKIVNAAYEVHKELGPGLLEGIYELCLYKELIKSGLTVKNQVTIPVVYKNELLSKCFCIDILVEDEIIIELKAVDKLLPVHKAQLLSYLKLSNKKLGLLINFNEALIKDGIVRMLNGELKNSVPL